MIACQKCGHEFVFLYKFLCFQGVAYPPVQSNCPDIANNMDEDRKAKDSVADHALRFRTSAGTELSINDKWTARILVTLAVVGVITFCICHPQVVEKVLLHRWACYSLCSRIFSHIPCGSRLFQGLEIEKDPLTRKYVSLCDSERLLHRCLGILPLSTPCHLRGQLVINATNCRFGSDCTGYGARDQNSSISNCSSRPTISAKVAMLPQEQYNGKKAPNLF